MERRKPAPKFLNLLQIQLPPGGIASIAHRVSGVLMFLSIPLLTWLFALSLQSEQGYRDALGILRLLPVRAATLVLAWSLAHHLLAGVRHLLLDLEIGMSRAAARRSAWLVNIGALGLTALLLVAAL